MHRFVGRNEVREIPKDPRLEVFSTRGKANCARRRGSASARHMAEMERLRETTTAKSKTGKGVTTEKLRNASKGEYREGVLVQRKKRRRLAQTENESVDSELSEWSPSDVAEALD